MPNMESPRNDYPPQNDEPPYLGMPKEQRKRILNNIEELITITDYERMLKDSIEVGLLTKTMCNKISSCGSDDESSRLERHRQLFKKISKRGPEAYQKLINLFHKLKHDKALKILQDNQKYISISSGLGKNPNQQPITSGEPPVINTIEQQSNDDDEVELVEYAYEIPANPYYKVQKATQIMEDNSVGVYEMKTQKNRGTLLIINIIKFDHTEEVRHGADNDTKSLLEVFKHLGFKLYAYENLTQNNFDKLLDKFLESDAVKETECVVFALMTHGSNESGNEFVQFRDGTRTEVNHIIKRFSNKKCKNLLSKPKILLFPFCRGTKLNVDTDHTQTDSICQAPSNSEGIPTYSDLCICYATVQGYPSHRDVVEGSWYIQHFCKSLADHAHEMHFEDILKIIHFNTDKLRSEDGSMQTANYNNIGFNRKLYFNPGFHSKA